MSGFRLASLLALIAAAAAAPLGSHGTDVNPENAPADALFKAGKFAEAEPLYAAITSKKCGAPTLGAREDLH
jgi:hypothetical protein